MGSTLFRIAWICVFPHQILPQFYEKLLEGSCQHVQWLSSFLQWQLLFWHHLTLSYPLVYRWIMQMCMQSRHPCPVANHIVGYGRNKCKHVFQSFVHRHHDYYRSWTSVTGKLLLVKEGISNDHDPFTVAIWKDGVVVVGHVPKSLTKITSFSLSTVYNGNMVLCELTGQRVNCEIRL